MKQVLLHTLRECLSGYTSRMSIENVYRQCLSRMSIREQLPRICIENVYPSSLAAYTWAVSFWIHFENVHPEYRSRVSTANIYRGCLSSKSFLYSLVECLCASTWRMSFWIHFGGCLSRMISRKTVSNCERPRHPPKSLWRKSFWIHFGGCLSRLDRLCKNVSVFHSHTHCAHSMTSLDFGGCLRLSQSPSLPRKTFSTDILDRHSR